MSLHVPSGIGGELSRLVGHESGLGRMSLLHEAQEIIGGVAFDIEFCGDGILECGHVRAAYMPLVGARMHRDAFGAKLLAVDGESYHIRIVFATRVAQRGHFVDIDAQSCHG